MYIAFKWLVGLTLTLWVAMCGLDVWIKKSIERNSYHCAADPVFTFPAMNFSRQSKGEQNLVVLKNKYTAEKSHEFLAIHFFMFFSGALVVAVLQRKHEIVNYTQNKFIIITTNLLMDKVSKFKTLYSKITAAALCNTIDNSYQYVWVKMKTWNRRILGIVNDWAKKNNPGNPPRLNLLLLNKLKEVERERRNLGQLLIAAIHENKNIRMHYQLESMAKNRLVQHIETAQKQIKENRSKYISFQQLYWVTHHENVYLKSRINKLIKDKEEAQENLMELINQVYRSKNHELKAYCCRFIVKTKDNLLNSDVNAEIRKFLRRPRKSMPNISSVQYSGNDLRTDVKFWPTRPSVNEFSPDDDGLFSLVSDAPKLKGLPGEIVWTVKDKHGLIEKLYEYDYDCNINNNDTLRRIRQYSVYYDKDCLLDFSTSSTENVQTTSGSNTFNVRSTTDASESKFQIEDIPTRRKFLTGSEVFQNFLHRNLGTILSSKMSKSSLTHA